MKRWLIGLLGVLLINGCQMNPVPSVWQSPEGLDHADLGRIVETRSGRSLTVGQLLDRLALEPRVILGEKHDNPDHHALQLWLLQALAERRKQGSVVLEMLDSAQQPQVDAVRQQIAAGSWPDDLPDALTWQPGWDWVLYSALVEYLLQQPYPLLSGNLSREELLRIYHQPSRPDGSVSGAPEVLQALSRQIADSHCGLLPESRLPAMLAVQQRRDRRMAEVLLAAPTPAVLVSGAFHASRTLGVPLHLQDLGAERGAAVLVMAEVGQRVEPAAADFVWYTAAQPEQDYCAVLRAKKDPVKTGSKP